LLGFCWIDSEEVVLVTSSGVEFYQVPLKRAPKLVKTYSISVNWFLFSVLPSLGSLFIWSLAGFCAHLLCCSPSFGQAVTKVLVVSSGPAANSMQIFNFKDGLISRLPKFDIPLPQGSADPKNQKLNLKDVSLAFLYNRIYLVHLSEGPTSSELVFFMITRDSTSRRYGNGLTCL